MGVLYRYTGITYVKCFEVHTATFKGKYCDCHDIIWIAIFYSLVLRIASRNQLEPF